MKTQNEIVEACSSLLKQCSERIKKIADERYPDAKEILDNFIKEAKNDESTQRKMPPGLISIVDKPDATLGDFLLARYNYPMEEGTRDQYAIHTMESFLQRGNNAEINRLSDFLEAVNYLQAFKDSIIRDCFEYKNDEENHEIYADLDSGIVARSLQFYKAANSIKEQMISLNIDETIQRSVMSDLEKTIAIMHENIPEKLKIEAFNHNPNKAFLNEGPETIAELLTRNGPALNPEKLGDYLTEEHNHRILKQYVNKKFNFKDKGFTQALREFLTSDFKLPGEAQKIDRMMNTFGENFYEKNKMTFGFDNKDTVYALAFSTIMLNTDLHNAAIKKKITLQQFIDNNRGIDNGKDINREILKNIYKEIKKNEIKIPSANSNNKTVNTSNQSGFRLAGFISKRKENRRQKMKEHQKQMQALSFVFNNLNESENRLGKDNTAKEIEAIKHIVGNINLRIDEIQNSDAAKRSKKIRKQVDAAKIQHAHVQDLLDSLRPNEKSKNNNKKAYVPHKETIHRSVHFFSNRQASSAKKSKPKF